MRGVSYEAASRRGVREGPLHVVLRKLGALVVSVVGDGDLPARGARVQIAGPELWPARAAETGEDGRVRIGSLAAGSYALRATQGERASPIELGILLDRGEQREVTLHLELGRMVAIRVTDGVEEDADPVRGAHVSLAEAGLSPFPLEANTDRDGRVRLGPITSGPASVTGRADGFVTVVRAVDVAQREVHLPLVHGGVLTGQVVDAHGFPVDGATIEVVGTDPAGAPIDDDPRRSRFSAAHFDASLGGPRALVASGELGVVPGPVPPITAAMDGPGARLIPSPDEPWVTRGDGTFRVFSVSPGRVRALVRHPQYVDAVSEVVTLDPGGEAHLDVVMHAGGSLEGRVVDENGRPLAGARVHVAAVRGSLERVSHTASDGTFAFAAMPETVTLTASPDGEAPAASRVSVSIPEGAVRTITVTLPSPRPSIAVHVTDDRNYALDAVELTASSLDSSVPLRATVFTDARGEASIAGVQGLPLRIEARAPGHATRIITTVHAEATVDIVLNPSETAFGEVRAARGGAPIADAELVLYGDAGSWRARTDRLGAFSFHDVAAGPARLRVRASGYALQLRDVAIEAAGARGTALARVELVDEALAVGVVIDARGRPVVGARVAKDQVPTYLAVGATPSDIAVTDSRGRFRLGELPAGEVSLEAYAPDVGRARVDTVELTAGRATDGIVITLQAASGEPTSDLGAAGGVAVTLGETAGDSREVVIAAVAEGSEAERAGLAPGDTIVEVDGAAVHTIPSARSRLSGPLADDVVMKIRRAGRADTLRIPREAVRR